LGHGSERQDHQAGDCQSRYTDWWPGLASHIGVVREVTQLRVIRWWLRSSLTNSLDGMLSKLQLQVAFPSTGRGRAVRRVFQWQQLEGFCLELARRLGLVGLGKGRERGQDRTVVRFLAGDRHL